MDLTALYQRVAALVDHLPPSLKADIDAAFADHAAANAPATEPVPAAGETDGEGEGA